MFRLRVFILIFLLFFWGKAFSVLPTQTFDFSLQDSLKTKDYSSKYFKKTSPFAVLAQGETVDTLDPFIDYNEFQDNVEEKESIAFLKSGRLLTIGILGGYEALTPNIREIYGDSLGVFGAYISFFFDLQVALQLSTVFPRRHYFNILRSRPQFSSYGIDFKYYFARQNLVEGIAILNPYVIFGPFLMKISNFFPEELFSTPVVPPPIQTSVPTPGEPSQTINTAPVPTTPGEGQLSPLTPEEQANAKAHSKVGAKIGLGLEIPFFKQTFIGIELTYMYLPLPFEARNLEGLQDIVTSQNPTLSLPRTQSASKKRHFLARAIEPEIPSNIHQKRFFGDLVQGVILVGINF